MFFCAICHNRNKEKGGIAVREIRDEALIQRWLTRERIAQQMDVTRLAFWAVRYDAGEMISTPDRPLDKLLFLTEGSVRIYGIRANGGLAPVNLVTKPAILGDVEFCRSGAPHFFAQAQTPVGCLALPLEPSRAVLEQDTRFLHLLLRSLADKLELFSTMDNVAGTLEERVLAYLAAPGAQIRGMDAATMRLRCSRRQLQRVLQKLCAEGRLQKVGRGQYRLPVAERAESAQ